jgi:orotidine-5'-phosphate decarboxylase
LDVKRGDIGSTAQAYAQAYLDPNSSLCADAITVSPYPGLGSLEPFYAAAARHGAGVFVLALTSNPGEGTSLQRARDADGRSVAQAVVDAVGARNDAGPHGSYGVVIGATTGPTTLDLTRLGGPVLVPGLGAQGAGPAELPAVLNGLTGVALPSYSRAVLRHGPSIEGLRKAVEMCLAECRNVRNNPVL